MAPRPRPAGAGAERRSVVTDACVVGAPPAGKPGRSTTCVTVAQPSPRLWPIIARKAPLAAGQGPIACRSPGVNLCGCTDLSIATGHSGERRVTMPIYIAMSGFIAANLTVIAAEVWKMRRIAQTRRG